MAIIEMNFYSDALKRNTVINVILPEEKKKEGGGAYKNMPYKTLYLLHGLSGNYNSFMRNSSVERYAAKYGIAVVMPEVGRSWYTDTVWGENNFTYITQELPELCRTYFRGMSADREYNYIAGYSMGGYGAVMSALTYPEKYAGCISLSGALDITRRNGNCDLMLWKANFDFDMHSPEELLGSKYDAFELVRKNAENSCALPRMYLCCGTEDHLIKVNRAFDKLLTECGIAHTYEEARGKHDWEYWDCSIQDGLRFLFEKN